MLDLWWVAESLGGDACGVNFSEGPACQVRYAPFARQFRFIGHDKRAPPGGRLRIRRAKVAMGICKQEASISFRLKSPNERRFRC